MPVTSPVNWPAPPTARTSSSRSGPNGSLHCGGCSTVSPRPTGPTRPTCPARRWPSPTTAAGQVSADPRSRRRRTLHPDQRALPLADLADAESVYGYSFILTNLDVSTSDTAVAVEHWYRHRTSIENVFRDSKHGAALRHLPSGYQQVNLAWMWGGLLATTIAGWMHQLTATQRPDGTLAGHGVRDGKAMISTLRRRLVRIPARLIRHARGLTLRLPPGHNLLAEILARLRALPTPP